MILTDSLREQHTRILDLTKQLTGKINSRSYQSKPDATVDLIVRLSGILNIHLAMEDKCLYPDLFRHKSRKVSDLARLYMDEMGGLRDQYQGYIAKWGHEQSIQGDPDTFEVETKMILEALTLRIHKEDRELYPAIEQVGM